ncbi:Bcr/CflA family drug resistance efflux transporter [Actinoplanes lobatus]|uniref:Bcr/CflA family drug resistance efflux transporter n=1 Tax=Actinoplanes lobatus TaxID=113568 RepID=A0A7W7MIK6_9ACTN|nr:multidrug effflux MFS transporter [Actinoplanes lobatus]MBB4751080.1 DHA1 family bicyclomycin/chloramphenicol resistance-like MFS transporter [Actinoplanes lobatus]GGN92604.1 Bcr/CflA family drug resistance efflux transporter [Actinoplanes lobatus]GIE44958.1 Bcr/CflA family drug resistance efflux transporter [Actinoplanes lobatus]
MTIRWPLLVVLASLTALAPVATDLYLPGFPAMGASLGADASGVQLTLTSFLAGLALGQLVMGPLADRYGRRRPLIAGTVACTVAGVACALAPTLPALVGFRFVQGFAGAAGMVIGRAVIADLAAGRAAARAFTMLVTVGGVAPVLAPLAGGVLSGPVGWRGMLWAVALLCVPMVVGVVVVVPETRPPGLSPAPLRRALRTVAASRGFWPPVVVFACSFGVMMAYIAASPFLYQDVIGLSEIGYGIVFGVNAAGLIGAGALAGRLVRRIDPARMVRWCVAAQVTATAGFAALAIGGAPVWTYPVMIFVAVAANGGIMGNTAALAMEPVRAVAGTGSAVLGFGQFAVGALVSPLVGLGGSGSAVVPALVMAGSSMLAGLVCRFGLDRDRHVVEQPA